MSSKSLILYQEGVVFILQDGKSRARSDHQWLNGKGRRNTHGLHQERGLPWQICHAFKARVPRKTGKARSDEQEKAVISGNVGRAF